MTLATGTAKNMPNKPPIFAPRNKEIINQIGFKPINSPIKRGATTLSVTWSIIVAETKKNKANLPLLKTIIRVHNIVKNPPKRGTKLAIPIPKANNKAEGTPNNIKTTRRTTLAMPTKIKRLKSNL